MAKTIKAVCCLSASLGLMPFNRMVSCAVKFTEAILAINNNAAPKASLYNSNPRHIPNVTVGGNNATATITPTKTEETPVVMDKAAAAPDARARANPSNPTLVRVSSSGVNSIPG